MGRSVWANVSIIVGINGHNGIPVIYKAERVTDRFDGSHFPFTIILNPDFLSEMQPNIFR